MTQRETKVFHNSRVVKKSEEEYNGKEVWTVTLDKEIFGGKYNLEITRVEPRIANRLQPGQQYSLVLERQNKKKGDYDGGRDWMFYWGLVGIADDGDAPRDARATDNAAPRQRAPGPSGWDPSPSDQWRADGQEKGNSVTNGTVMVLGYFAQHGVLPTPEWLKEAATLVNFASEEIRFGRVAGQIPGDAPEGGPDAPAEDDEDVLFLEDALDSQEPFPEGRV